MIDLETIEGVQQAVKLQADGMTLKQITAMVTVSGATIGYQSVMERINRYKRNGEILKRRNINLTRDMIEAYRAEGLSRNAVARRHGCSKDGIIYYERKFNLFLRDHAEPIGAENLPAVAKVPTDVARILTCRWSSGAVKSSAIFGR